jgi:hypothetical protein
MYASVIGNMKKPVLRWWEMARVRGFNNNRYSLFRSRLFYFPFIAIPLISRSVDYKEY